MGETKHIQRACCQTPKALNVIAQGAQLLGTLGKVSNPKEPRMGLHKTVINLSLVLEGILSNPFRVHCACGYDPRVRFALPWAFLFSAFGAIHSCFTHTKPHRTPKALNRKKTKLNGLQERWRPSRRHPHPAMTKMESWLVGIVSRMPTNHDSIDLLYISSNVCSRPSFAFFKYSSTGAKYFSSARALKSSPVFSRKTSRQSRLAPGRIMPSRNFPTSTLP